MRYSTEKYSFFCQAGRDISYAQMYIHDTQEALAHAHQQRVARNEGTTPEIMLELQDMMHANNPYIPMYRTAHEILLALPVAQRNIECRIHLDESADQRRYNLPQADQIAAILPGNAENATHGRDIILRLRQGEHDNLQRIYEDSPTYTPLLYVLLFPYGEIGFHRGIPLVGEDEHDEHDDNGKMTLFLNQTIFLTCDFWIDVEGGRNTVTYTRFWAYRLHNRMLPAGDGLPARMEPTTILRSGRLSHQLIVDVWACAEQLNLRWIKQNQATIRSELYGGLVDALNGNQNANPAAIGQQIILPSSHIGSPRHMMQLYQDTMAAARFFGPATYFITVTANPNWPEVLSALLQGQVPADRPDLVDRVFYEKLSLLFKTLTVVFGKQLARVHVIEFQKRGLPHAHLLLWIDWEDKPQTSEDLDKVSCIVMLLLFQTRY
jgi:Helitron helicase-like domain at N-terminus